MDRYVTSTTEREMLSTLEGYAQVEGGYCWHVRDARGQKVVGLTDTIILLPPKWHGARRPGTLGFFELKTQRDVLSPVQRHVLAMLDQATEIVSGVIRPRPRNVIEITLDDALELLGKEPL